jgi:hypothetical protein
VVTSDDFATNVGHASFVLGVQRAPSEGRYPQFRHCVHGTLPVVQLARKRIASVLTKPPFPGDPPNVLHGRPRREGDQAPAVMSELGVYDPVLVDRSGKIDVVLAGPPGSK